MNNRLIVVMAVVLVAGLVAISHSMKGPRCSAESVKAQLQEMVDAEQVLRSKIDGSFNPEKNAEHAALKEQIRTLDRINTAALKSILKTTPGGWITISEFGAVADKNAWLLVQHADQDREFQYEVLNRLEQLCAQNETDCTNVAYLADRVAVAQKLPQKYGTQFKVQDGTIVFDDIEDRANIDARRAEKGLPSLKEYEQMAREAYKLAPPQSK